MTRDELNSLIAEAIAPRRSLVVQLTSTTDGGFEMPSTVFVVIAGAAWAEAGIMAAIAEGVRAIAHDEQAEVLTYWQESATIHGVRYISRQRHRFAWVRIGVGDVVGYPQSEAGPAVVRAGSEIPEINWEK